MSELGRAGLSDLKFLFELRELTASTGRSSRSNSVSYLICMISKLFTFQSHGHFKELKYEVVFMDDLHFLRHEIFE